MQAEKQVLVRCNGRIFLALCIIFFMGCTTQGVPVQMGRYMKVRCRPDTLSSNCLEEHDSQVVIADGAANTSPPKSDPMQLKKFQDHSDVSEEEYGSGTEIELESGSGMDDNADVFMAQDILLYQPDQNLKLRFTDEGLFLQNQRL